MDERQHQSRERDSYSQRFEKIFFGVIVSGVIISSSYKAINQHYREQDLVKKLEMIEKSRDDPRYKAYKFTKDLKEKVKEMLTYRLVF